MRGEKRKKEVRLRKRIIPLSLLLTCLWILLFGFVYFIEPANAGIVVLFFILVFIATLLTAAVIFANTRRGILTASTICIFLVLRYFGLGNILNLALLIAIILTAEFYLAKR